MLSSTFNVHAALKLAPILSLSLKKKRNAGGARYLQLYRNKQVQWHLFFMSWYEEQQCFLSMAILWPAEKGAV